jgi:hypothetical protein
MPAKVLALKQLLEQQFPDAVPIVQRTALPVATGVGPIDGILPSAGLPRARLTVWRPYGGATAKLRASCHNVIANGERSAWVDGLGTIAGAYWDPGPILVRPRDRRNALRAAEELLRSGAFGLVVLTGVEPEGTETVRLSRAVREGGGAFVAITNNAAMASLRLTSRIHPGGYHWVRNPFGDPAQVKDIGITARAMTAGWNASTTFRIPVTQHELRLSLDPGLVDRRGVKPDRQQRMIKAERRER